MAYCARSQCLGSSRKQIIYLLTIINLNLVSMSYMWLQLCHGACICVSCVLTDAVPAMSVHVSCIPISFHNYAIWDLNVLRGSRQCAQRKMIGHRSECAVVKATRPASHPVL